MAYIFFKQYRIVFNLWPSLLQILIKLLLFTRYYEFPRVVVSHNKQHRGDAKKEKTSKCNQDEVEIAHTQVTYIQIGSPRYFKFSILNIDFQGREFN